MRSTLKYTVLALLALINVLPLYWLVRSSLMTQKEIFAIPIQFAPGKFVWSNYKDAVENVPFFLYLKNTALLVALSVIGTLFSTSFAAFALARIPFRTKRFWFGMVLICMMIPSTVMLIPQFIGWRWLGAYDSYWPLVLPSFLGISVLGTTVFIFMLRQFYMSIPLDYDEAAYLDGANPLQIYGRVILPLSKPALTSVGIFTFMATWNDYFGPLLYLSSETKWNFSLGLSAFMSQYSMKWELIMAYSTLTFIPLLILFFVAQRAFVEGINVGGIKG